MFIPLSTFLLILLSVWLISYLLQNNDDTMENYYWRGSASNYLSPRYYYYPRGYWYGHRWGLPNKNQPWAWRRYYYW